MVTYKCQTLPSSDKLVVHRNRASGDSKPRVAIEAWSGNNSVNSAHLDPQQAAHLGRALLAWAENNGEMSSCDNIVGNCI